MNRQEFLAFHKSVTDKMHEITKAKNADYAGPAENSDPFANFRLVGHFGAATPEQGFFTRMTDKMARISSFIQAGTLQVKDESVEDTLFDLANYCILFAAYLRGEKEAKAAVASPCSWPTCKKTAKGTGFCDFHAPAECQVAGCDNEPKAPLSDLRDTTGLPLAACLAHAERHETGEALALKVAVRKEWICGTAYCGKKHSDANHRHCPEHRDGGLPAQQGVS